MLSNIVKDYGESDRREKKHIVTVAFIPLPTVPCRTTMNDSRLLFLCDFCNFLCNGFLLQKLGNE